MANIIRVASSVNFNNLFKKAEDRRLNKKDLQVIDNVICLQCLHLKDITDTKYPSPPNLSDTLDTKLGCYFVMRSHHLQTLIHFIARDRLCLDWAPSYDKIQRFPNVFAGPNGRRQGVLLEFLKSIEEDILPFATDTHSFELDMYRNMRFIHKLFQILLYAYVFPFREKDFIEFVSKIGEFKFHFSENGESEFQVQDYSIVYTIKNKQRRYTCHTIPWTA